MTRFQLSIVGWMVLMAGSVSAFAQESEFKVTYKAAHATFEKKDFAAAAILFRKAAEIGERTWGKSDARVTEAKDNQGRSYLNINEYQNGLSAYIVAYRETMGIKNKGERTTAIRSAYGLAQALNGLKRYEEAIPYANWAIGILTAGGDDQEYLYSIRNELASSYEHLNRYKEAEAVFQASLNASPTKAQKRYLLGRVGWMRFRMKDFDLAARKTKEQIELLDLSTEDGVLTAAHTNYDLSTIYLGKPDLDKALDAVREAARLYELTGSAGRDHLAEAHHRIGETLIKLKQYDAAKEAYLKAAVIYEGLSQPQKCADTYYNLAFAAYQSGQNEDAEQFAGLALAKHDRLGSSALLDVAWDVALLGHLCCAKKKFATAERHYQRALSIREQAPGKPNADDSRKNLAYAKSQTVDVSSKDLAELRTLALRNNDPGVGLAVAGEPPP